MSWTSLLSMDYSITATYHAIAGVLDTISPIDLISSLVSDELSNQSRVSSQIRLPQVARTHGPEEAAYTAIFPATLATAAFPDSLNAIAMRDFVDF